jgi:F-type H+-transporting ATPase subunit delta
MVFEQSFQKAKNTSLRGRGPSVASQAGSRSGIAGRYASALYELADEQKALDAVADDLRAFRALLGESEDLVRLVRSPNLARESQVKALQAIAAKAGAHSLSSNFLALVAKNRRLFALDGIIGAFLEILAERRGEVTAHVTSARELTDEQLAKLTDAVKRTVGAQAQVETHVDPKLLGGLIVRVGSRMYDSSLSSKLQRLENSMKGAA